MKTPKAGDFGLSVTAGHVGWWINIAQAITGDSSRYTHAFIVLDDETVLEAQAQGAIISPLSKYTGRAVFSSLDLTDSERAGIVREARALIGTPYGFTDYLSLALLHWGIRPEWVKNRIKGRGRMICSQLVDEVYLRAGVHLFHDGRWAQDVTPGDLANLLLERDWLES